MKKQINDLLLKMQSGENCIGETANAILGLFNEKNPIVWKCTSDLYMSESKYKCFTEGEKYNQVCKVKERITLIDDDYEEHIVCGEWLKHFVLEN